MCRLSAPHRATSDLDVVDRLFGTAPQLEVLRAATGAKPVEPAAVLLRTPSGDVKIDALEVRQIELDEPSDDPGDGLHASAHARANDTSTDVTIEAVRGQGERLAVTTKVAEPGPLIAMKIQAVMHRSVDKQGTDLLDIVRPTLDPETRPAALTQIGPADEAIARDIAVRVDHRWRATKSRPCAGSAEPASRTSRSTTSTWSPSSLSRPTTARSHLDSAAARRDALLPHRRHRRCPRRPRRVEGDPDHAAATQD